MVGLLPLYARVTVDGRRVEISLKKKVSPEKWNPKAGMVKGNSEEARTVNSYLNQIKNQLFKLYYQMKQNEAFITADAIKVQFNGPRDNRKTLLEVFRFHNQKLEKLVGIDVLRATLTKFNTIYKKVESFIRHHYQKPDVYLEELTPASVGNLEFYLKTQEGIDHNTAMRYIRSTRKIITLAHTNSWLTSHPFQHFRCTLRKVERNTLTAEELQCLASKNFGIARLVEVRDIFLFCCYTGLAFIDIQKLTQTHIVIGMDR
jgi:hypothetical protein